MRQVSPRWPLQALVSVYDKTGIVEFAQGLVALGFVIWSSGGTAKVLAAAGVRVFDVALLAGGEAMLGHRVVTLSREKSAAILAVSSKDEDLAELEKIGIKLRETGRDFLPNPCIDLVCCDMYPLADEVSRPGATDADVVEKTDIGGPTMLAEAAKNFLDGKIAICDPADRQRVLNWMQAGCPDESVFLRELAGKVWFEQAKYRMHSARHFGGYDGVLGRPVQGLLGYAENRWQKLVGTGYFATDDKDPLALHRFERFEGGPSGFVGITDFSRALALTCRIAAAFEVNFAEVPYIAVGVKHGNACGAGIAYSSRHDLVRVAVRKVVHGDPEALFGGFVVVNFEFGKREAQILLHEMATDKRPIDGVVAPGYTPEAIEILGRKSGKCRLYRNSALASLGVAALDKTDRIVRVRGGFIKQSSYAEQLFNLSDAAMEWVVVGSEFPFKQRHDAVLAACVCGESNSNTVVIVKNGLLIGSGVGQKKRKACAALAVREARESGHDSTGSVAWSDSFFPFPDGLDILIRAGVRVVGASRGSMRDDLVFRRASQGARRNAGFTLLTAPDAKMRGFSYHTG